MQIQIIIFNWVSLIKVKLVIKVEFDYKKKNYYYILENLCKNCHTKLVCFNYQFQTVLKHT